MCHLTYTLETLKLPPGIRAYFCLSLYFPGFCLNVGPKCLLTKPSQLKVPTCSFAWGTHVSRSRVGADVQGG